MRSHQILLVVLVAFCALSAQDGANGQALKKLFGMVGKTEGEAPASAEVVDDYDQKSAADGVDVETVDAPAAVEEAGQERDQPATTTPRPGFFHQFSFPTLPPFTFPPFPAIPALPALPAIPPLPQLPQLPNLATIFPSLPPRQTIVATQTLLVEVTRRVTRVPICMSVAPKSRPCVVNDDTVQGGSSYYRADSDSLWADEVAEDGRMYIQPTASFHFPSEMSTATPLEGESREGKYLELKAARGEEDLTADLQSSIVQPHAVKPIAAGAVVAGVGPIAAVLGLGLPVTHIVKKKLYVTRVDTVTDYRATATLVAHNCVPTGVNIPYCRGPAQKPYNKYSGPPTQYPPQYPPQQPPQYPPQQPPQYPPQQPPQYPPQYPPQQPPQYPPRRPPAYPTTRYTTRYTTPRTTYPTTYPTTGYTTRYTTPRTTYPTTYPTTGYTTRYTTPRTTPYTTPYGSYPPNPPPPSVSPYKAGELDEQVDAAENVDENLTKA